MWLNVLVTGTACVTLTRSQQHSTQITYLKVIETSRLRFDQPGRKELFKVKLQCQVKKVDASWGEYGDAILS